MLPLSDCYCYHTHLLLLFFMCSLFLAICRGVTVYIIFLVWRWFAVLCRFALHVGHNTTNNITAWIVIVLDTTTADSIDIQLAFTDTPQLLQAVSTPSRLCPITMITTAQVNACIRVTQHLEQHLCNQLPPHCLFFILFSYLLPIVFASSLQCFCFSF